MRPKFVTCGDYLHQVRSGEDPFLTPPSQDPDVTLICIGLILPRLNSILRRRQTTVGPKAWKGQADHRHRWERASYQKNTSVDELRDDIKYSTRLRQMRHR